MRGGTSAPQAAGGPLRPFTIRTLAETPPRGPEEASDELASLAGIEGGSLILNVSADPDAANDVLSRLWGARTVAWPRGERTRAAAAPPLPFET
ncbi:MAG: hypothetical protein FJ029_00525 [Actinobacteria bacterium]|nr:hypothetical protein [Actinomycetota bacterium]